MYSTCLFCHAKFGRNESVENFPIGRRLAFDAAKGRLWVVCHLCQRWSLSPLDERWEAIEECEKLNRDTRRRVSTENVGLARVGDGQVLRGLQPALRLAIEMALHEDDERRAMEGELAALRDRWEEAEEIAAISDALFAQALPLPRRQ